MSRLALTLAVFLPFFAAHARADDAAPEEEAAKVEEAPKPEDKCPKIKGKEPVVYGIGGSTMGSLLGPMLKTVFAEHKVTFKRWGKASSGLARPDFHDWPATAPELMETHQPDIVIISLGTNDYQPLWVDGNWVKQEDENWDKLYGERVDALLAAVAGKNKRRMIIWSGPYAFEGPNAEVRAPIVNRIMRERVEAFAAAGGRAVFHDAYTVTSDDKGKPLNEAVLPGRKKAVEIRTKDKVHLTSDAVRHLLAEPIVEMTLPCFAKKERGTKARSAGTEATKAKRNKVDKGTRGSQPKGR